MFKEAILQNESCREKKFADFYVKLGHKKNLSFYFVGLLQKAIETKSINKIVENNSTWTKEENETNSMIHFDGKCPFASRSKRYFLNISAASKSIEFKKLSYRSSSSLKMFTRILHIFFKK